MPARSSIISLEYVTESTKNERSVAAKADAPIFGIDSFGRVNEWNDETAEITGYSSKEALGKPLVSTFIVSKLQAIVTNILDTALQGKETSNYELEFTTKSNEIRNLLVNATTRRDPDSNIIGVEGVEEKEYIINDEITSFLWYDGS
eukprot:scaffold2802_cov276-Chaetoceros_neogracile.AAC.8